MQGITGIEGVGDLKTRLKHLDLNDLNLTSNERERRSPVIKGNSYKVIAGAIFISLKTLNWYTRNIYRKTNVHSGAELTARIGNSL